MKDIIENYKDIILNKYAHFEGRASRREFWYFVLANFLISVILGVVEGILGISPETDRSVLTDIYSLLVLVPSVAVAARRLHDIDKSGWWMVVPLYNIYLFFQKGHPGTNRFNTELAPIPAASVAPESTPPPVPPTA